MKQCDSFVRTTSDQESSWASTDMIVRSPIRACQGAKLKLPTEAEEKRKTQKIFYMLATVFQLSTFKRIIS
ncbi:hypothetical protein GCK32_006934 [Trichostrongylus colubriformis]|uniref:Uncharacterized protein n=1 Tax=Trichostrongylus colubriformis TaxID=6319 RepID=A0AAN8EZP5_TRICO